VDRDQFKVDTVRAGSAPFFEPGLEQLVRDSVNAGRLTASVSLSEALADADVALICVGTPSEKNGNWDSISCGAFPRRSPSRSLGGTSRW
jgi:GDP-mannose 6-dehydrogenase